MKISRGTTSLYLFIGMLIGLGTTSAPLVFVQAQSPSSQGSPESLIPIEASDEEKKQIQAAERFMTVLTKSPRRGTPLDRVYGHHVEFGTLEPFLDGLRESVQKKPNDGATWMLIGLFESQRGADTAALAAFQEAERIRSTDPLAPYYLAQSFIRLGESKQAVDAMERAIKLQPPRADLMEIFQQLGRVHQRAQRTEEAFQVWRRMEEKFPDDERVLEQIASILNEEGQYDMALPRYEKLAKIARDDYRRTTFRMTIAELKIKLSKRDDGIQSFEAILSDLNPESWIYKDVRRRIEEIFLRSGDQDSLVKYYDSWLTKHPDDVDAMVRLAKYLSSVARTSEANQRLEQALQLAPSRSDLRRSYIDQLIDDDNLDKALKQFKVLCEQSPNNADYLRDWGKVLLKNKESPQETRNQDATRVWNMMLKGHEKDALVHTQVADLFRNANLNQRAMELYKKAVELAPSQPQYREYLGEFLHLQKKVDEAKQVWAEIAAGSQRNAENLARLAEVYSSFGYTDDAVREINEACKLAPKDFAMQLQGAEFNLRASQHDQALQGLLRAEALAANDEERESVTTQRIEVLQSCQRLESETDKLASEIASKKSTLDDWLLLARFHEAGRQYTNARTAIEKGLQLRPQSIPLLMAAARVAEASGDYGKAAGWSRQLAKIDRRSRDDHLRNVARLESQLGRPKEAMAAANDLILAAPGNTENYEFLAQLCFKLGKKADGVEALRRAVRINPNDPNLMIALANTLAEQLQTREAIELLWRAFDKSDEVEDKTSLISKIAPLYVELGQTEQLLERLERDRKVEEKRRTLTICLAQAHQSLDDLYTARQELEGLLSESTRDTNLLQQLAKLCQSLRDLDAAVGYQRQLVAIAPGPETELPLAEMLNLQGEKEEASEIVVRLTRREQDPVRLLKSLDSLLIQQRHEEVIDIIEPLVSQQRDNWELLYREAVAWFSLNKVEEAKIRFQRILDLDVPHEQIGAKVESTMKAAQQKAKAESKNSGRLIQIENPTPLQSLAKAEEIRRATSLATDTYYNPGQPQKSFWSPDTYADARMVSFAWQLRILQDADRISSHKDSEADDPVTAYYNKRTDDALQSTATINTIRDGLYVSMLFKDNPMAFKIARGLPRLGGREEKLYYLGTLAAREFIPDSQSRNNRDRDDKEAKRTPLSSEDLDLAIECYESSLNDQLGQREVSAYGGSFYYATNGQTYYKIGDTYQLLSATLDSRFYTPIILEELRLAGRDADAESFLAKTIESQGSPSEVETAMRLLLKESRLEDLPRLLVKWKNLVEREIEQTPLTSNHLVHPAEQFNHVSQASDFLCQWIGRLASDEDSTQILAIIDTAIDIKLKENAWQRKYDATHPKKGVTSSSPQSLGTSIYTVVYFGKENDSSSTECPVDIKYLSREMAILLYQARDSFLRAKSDEELLEHLKGRMAKVDDSDRSLASLWLATVMYWNEDQETAAELVVEALKGMPKDLLSQLQLAELFTRQQDFQKALDVIDQLPVKDQKEVQQRELIALRLSERIGNTERAKIAAERLFGWKLDVETQKQLAESMRRLGMQSYANAILARVERTAIHQDRGSANLMTLLYGQGKVDQAKQIAYQILQRTTASQSKTGRASMNATRANDGRSQAIALLQQTGDLTKLIEQAEEQVARSPQSIKRYDILMEFYQAANQPEKSLELVQRVLALNPKLTELRLKLALSLEQGGEIEKACDEYLIVMRDQPRLLTNELQRVQRLFESTKRVHELIDALDQIDVREMGHPYYILDVIAELMQEENQSPQLLRILEKLYDRFPNYRQQLLSNVHNTKLWKIDQVFSIAKRSLVPSIKQRNVPSWYGLSQIQNYGDDGNANATVHTLFQAVQGTPKSKELEESIDSAIQAHPKWYAGKALAAMLRIKSGRRDEGIQLFKELLQNDQAVESMPAAACWLIGQDIDEVDDLQNTAVELYERFLHKEPVQTQQAQYSPLARLVRLCERNGDREKAKASLINVAQKSGTSNHSREYDEYIRFENTFWAADKLLALGEGIDAIRIINDAMRNPRAVRIAASWHGQGIENYSERVSQITSQALQQMTGEIDPSWLEGLLTVHSQKDATTPRLDLIVPTWNFTDGLPPSGETSRSEIVRLLVKLCKTPSILQGVDARFRKLHESYPNDFSITIAWCLLREQLKREQLDEVLHIVLHQCDSQPMEEIALGRRANNRQRREASHSIPLWLIAERLIQDKDRVAITDKLLQRSLDAAFRQVDQQQAAAVGMYWAELLAKRGRNNDLQAHLKNMLERVTVRPGMEGTVSKTQQTGSEASATFSEDTDSATHSSMAPLTNLQFEVAIKIALLAAKAELPDLSRFAMEESLRTGLPLEDMSGSYGDPFGGGLFSNGSNQPLYSEAGTTDPEMVAMQVQEVLSVWKGADFPAMPAAQILLKLLFPESRPQDIEWFDGDLHSEKPSFAWLTVQWCSKAEYLEELLAKIEERQTLAQAKLNGTVLRGLIALHQRRIEDVGLCLKELDATIRSEARPESIRSVLDLCTLAAKEEELRSAASDIVYTVTKEIIARGNGYVVESEIVKTMVRNLVQRGDIDRVNAFFENVLLGTRNESSRYGGEYGDYNVQKALISISEIYASMGLYKECIDYFGRAHDFELQKFSAGNSTLSLTLMAQYGRSLSLEDRYQLWADWTLPSKHRRSIRFAFGKAETLSTPSFLTEKRSTRLSIESFPHTGLVSNWIELLDAAKELNRLEDMHSNSQQWVKDHLPNARAFHALLLVYRSHHPESKAAAETAILECFTKSKEEPAAVAPGKSVSHELELTLFLSGLQHDIFSLAARFDWFHHWNDRLRSLFDNHNLEGLKTAFAADLFRRGGHSPSSIFDAKALPYHNLKNWIVETIGDGSPKSNAGLVGSVWLSDGSTITGMTGPSPELLFFRVPLMGDFEFTMDGYNGHGGASDAGYNSVTIESRGVETQIRTVDQEESLERGKTLDKESPDLHTIRIVSKEGNLEYWLNGYRVYQEKIIGTFPWITIRTNAQCTNRIQNMRVHGKPEIPRSIPLVLGDRMDGWAGASKPHPRTMAEDVSELPQYHQSRELQREEKQDRLNWLAKDGVLEGTGLSPEYDQWIVYQRPLQPKEIFQYEFYFDPERISVYPSIDSIVLAIDGSEIHAILPSKNEIEDKLLSALKEKRKLTIDGANAPKLLPKEWNHASMSWVGDQIELRINGTICCSINAKDLSSTCFGLYYPNDQRAKIRNATLSGDWLETWESFGDEYLAETTRPLTAVDKQLLSTLIPLEVELLNAREIVQKASKLSDSESLALLEDWVLPSDPYGRFRMGIDWMTNNEQPGAATVGNSNAFTLYRLLSPAQELVRRVHQSGKAKEYREKWLQWNMENPIESHSRDVLVAMLDIESNDPRAKEEIAAIYDRIATFAPVSRESVNRYPELNLAIHAGAHPVHWRQGIDLAYLLRNLERDEKKAIGNSRWEELLATVLGNLESKQIGDSRMGSLSLADAKTPHQWTCVPLSGPRSLGRGHDDSRWLFERGSVRQLPGVVPTRLLFQSPLTGSYEIHAKLSTWAYREVQIGVGMFSAQPRHDLKSLQLFKLGRTTKEVGGLLAIPHWDSLSDFRISVRNHQMMTEVNGIKIHDHTFPSAIDPWIVIQSRSPHSHTSIRDLRITGSPQIPEEIDLLGQSDLLGWRNYFDESGGDLISDGDESNVDYKIQNRELKGRIRKDIASNNVEGLLQYVRPMLEDGELEYESFFDPGKVEAYPALGDLALISRPEGLAIHTITHAQWETRGWTSTNETVHNQKSAAPWKPREWNHVRLKLVGDTLTLYVNSTEVAQVPITAQPQARFFGLFRYNDKTELRVRKMKYRGEWPKTLPTVEEQELAIPSDKGIALSEQETGNSLKLPLSLSETEGAKAGLTYLGKKDGIRQTEQGLELTLQDGSSWDVWPGISIPVGHSNDVETRLSFDGLQCEGKPNGWGAVLSMQVEMEDADRTVVEVSTGIKTGGEPTSRANLRRSFPNRDHATLEQESISYGTKSGELRLFRRGGQVHCFVWIEDTKSLLWINSVIIGDAPIKNISIQAKASDNESRVSVTLKELSIRHGK